MKDRATEGRFLPVKLTSAEITERSSELAAVSVQADELADKKKSAVQAYKAEEDHLKERIKKLAMAVHTGKESREVPCNREKDFAARVELVIRCDTGEIVESRPLTIAELQGELPFRGMTGVTYPPETEPECTANQDPEAESPGLNEPTEKTFAERVEAVRGKSAQERIIDELISESETELSDEIPEEIDDETDGLPTEDLATEPASEPLEDLEPFPFETPSNKPKNPRKKSKRLPK